MKLIQGPLLPICVMKLIQGPLLPICETKMMLGLLKFPQVFLSNLHAFNNLVFHNKNIKQKFYFLKRAEVSLIWFAFPSLFQSCLRTLHTCYTHFVHRKSEQLDFDYFSGKHRDGKHIYL